MNTQYRRASYDLSAHQLQQLPDDLLYEVAFAGRSNAGKSSAINTITDIKSLCRVSKQPGRTQAINVFRLDGQHALIDLPGYGYAKVPKAMKLKWQQVMSRYLETREALRGLILVMDIRHPLTDHDQQMLSWADTAELPVHCLLTKADKLKRGAAKNTLLKVRRDLTEIHPTASAQIFSALKREGVAEAHAQLDIWMGYAPDPHSNLSADMLKAP